MRAVVVHAFAPLTDIKVEEFPDPAPQAGEVLVDIKAIGLNFSDRLMIEGRYQIRPDCPFVPGRDACGVVAAVGTGVTGCKPGDRVMTVMPYGAYGEKTVAPESRCFVIPNSMDFTSGAALGNAYITAYLALTQSAAIKPNDVILVTGASGGVGLAAIELAQALGASIVIAGVTSADKGELALRHHADHWVDLSAADLVRSLRDQVQAATGGKGVDIVLDIVGGAVFDAALRCLAQKGRMVSIGFASGAIPEAKANYLLLKNLKVVGCHSELYYAEIELMKGVVDDLFRFHEQGKIHPEIMATYPLEEFQAALAHFGTGQIRGKIVLTTGGDRPQASD
jgi:NADPH2:quinone reductase